MQEKIQFTSKVISLGSEENSLYMELSMVFLDDIQNLNDIKFTKNFLTDVEMNKDKYIGLPLVGDVNALTSGKYQGLTHLFNKKTGEFLTQALGSFVDFKTELNDGVNQLIATSRVWKRYPKVCLAMQELFNSEQGLSFSYEVLVGKYTVEDGCKIIDKDDLNTIASSCVVSNPANPASIALTLCAAVEEDLKDQEDIAQEIGDTASKNNKEIHEEDNTMAKTVAELEVELAAQNLFIKEKDAKLKEKDAKLKEKDTEIDTSKKDAKAKDEEVAAKDKEVKTKCAEIAEINEKLTTLSASILEKDKLIAELEPIKKAYGIAEAAKVAEKLVADKVALKEKYSKLLDEKVMAEVEIAEALDKLDEAKLNSKIVELAMAAATKETPKVEAGSRITDSVNIGKNDLTSKYITIQ